MNTTWWSRIVVMAVLLGWSILSYGFVRGALEQVLPGFGDIVATTVMTLLLMVPMLFLTPLWFLSSLVEYSRSKKRKSRGECRQCGHSLEARIDGPCPECGSDQRVKPVESRRLVGTCLVLWISATLIGSGVTEVIARLDEHSFIRMHEHSSLSAKSRSRAWPLWGSLEWDEATRTAKGSFLNGRFNVLDFNP